MARTTGRVRGEGKTHDVGCALGSELHVVRDEDDGATLEERALEAVLVLSRSVPSSAVGHAHADTKRPTRGTHDVRCSVRVDGREDVVEEEDRRAAVDGASERDACFLTAAGCEGTGQLQGDKAGPASRRDGP